MPLGGRETPRRSGAEELGQQSGRVLELLDQGVAEHRAHRPVHHLVLSRGPSYVDAPPGRAEVRRPPARPAGTSDQFMKDVLKRAEGAMQEATRRADRAKAAADKALAEARLEEMLMLQ